MALNSSILSPQSRTCRVSAMCVMSPDRLSTLLVGMLLCTRILCPGLYSSNLKVCVAVSPTLHCAMVPFAL